MKKSLVGFICWLDRLHWLWLGLAAPFLLFPTPKRSLAMFVVPGLWAIHMIAVRLTSRSSHPSSQIPSALPLTPLNIPILLMAIMVLISIWATYDITISLRKISGMVLGFGVYFAIAREGKSTMGWWSSLLAFIGIGVGIAILGILGTRWSTEKFLLFIPLTSQFPQLIAGLEGAEKGLHPNEIAGSLLWVLPIMFTLSVSLQTIKRREDLSSMWSAWVPRLLLWLSTLIVFAIFVLTQSRSSYLALLITVVVIFLVAIARRERLLLSGIFLIAGLLIIPTLILIGNSSMSWERMLDSALISWRSFLYNHTVGPRIEIWYRAVFALHDFSVAGMGMDTFRHVVNVIYPISSISKDIGHAHNEFLQAGLDLGIAGMVAFIALYICAFWMLARIWQRISGSLSRGVVLGLAGGLFAHLLFGMTDAIALGAKPGLLFWMLLGLISGLYAQAFSFSDSKSTNGQLKV